ncbi:cell wall-binding repeat-containing protein [Candidatus Poriferisodalis sp.]|uniref:cell wall-binding repeat-containing protein n=1 Tax=Candidatus Poriferisodalis sp. TaxID=3101277 RepID=UPI003B02012D
MSHTLGRRNRGLNSPARRARHRRRPFSLGLAAAVLAGSVVLAPRPAAAQSADITAQRVAGSSVYDIAVNVAGVLCSTEAGSHSVALASGENWPDALAGAALDRPLLLTKQAFLPAITRLYLAPCVSHPKAKVIILGGSAAVSESVADTLRAMGYEVDRIAGADRYETARRAASVFAPDTLSTVHVASGRNFADAIAAAPNVSKGTPLILTPPDELHPQARRFLTDEDRTVESVTILGGMAAVSAEVEAEIKAFGIDTSRVAGADRYETAAEIARRAFSTAGCHPVTDVAVASGTIPFGGLAAGAVRGPCQPLLLAPDPNSPVPEALAEFGRDWALAIGAGAEASVTGIGPSSVISSAAILAVSTGISASTGDPDGATGELNWTQLAPAVVRVECLDISGRPIKIGSGFFVDDGRTIVTNYHVVEADPGRPCRRIRASLGGTFEQEPTREMPVALKRSAPARDLALLVTDPDIAANRTLALSTEALRVGETITALGYPRVGGATLTLTTGRYSGTQQLDGLTWINTDTPIALGNSGGPVLNDRQEVVGVATLLRISVSNGTALGALSLLVPAEDVIALIAGDLGE